MHESEIFTVIVQLAGKSLHKSLQSYMHSNFGNVCEKNEQAGKPRQTFALQEVAQFPAKRMNEMFTHNW